MTYRGIPRRAVDAFPLRFSKQWEREGTLYTACQVDTLEEETLSDLEDAFGERDDVPRSLEVAAGFPYGGDQQLAAHRARQAWHEASKVKAAQRERDRARKREASKKEYLAAEELLRALERQAIDDRKAQAIGARFLQQDPGDAGRRVCPLCGRQRRQAPGSSVLCLHNGKFQVRFPQSDEWTETG